MVFHMKSTFNIDDHVFRQLKIEAARRGQTMTELLEAALRRFLESETERKPLPPLPTFDGGGHLIDIANRESLYEVLDDFSLYKQ